MKLNINCIQKNTILSFIFVFCLIMLLGCNFDIPEGKGKIVIENDINDTCYIEKVWIRKYGNYKWELQYDDGDEYNNQKYVRLYPGPGEYSIRVRACFYNFLPIDIYSGIFCTKNVEEGEMIYLHFDGISIHE